MSPLGDSVGANVGIDVITAIELASAGYGCHRPSTASISTTSR